MIDYLSSLIHPDPILKFILCALSNVGCPKNHLSYPILSSVEFLINAFANQMLPPLQTDIDQLCSSMEGLLTERSDLFRQNDELMTQN